jgi:hypothetical protein
MTTLLKSILKKERISLVLLTKTIKDQVTETGEKPVNIANLSRIINGVQEGMLETTLNRILNAINELRTRPDEYSQNDILGEIDE